MKSENKSKRKGIKVLSALGEENLAERMEENNKKNTKGKLQVSIKNIEITIYMMHGQINVMMHALMQ